MIGVYWGAFDPPTVAHIAIINEALKQIPLKKLIVVVNNHQYKKYVYPLQDRIKLVEQMLGLHDRERIEIMWQDETTKLDYDSIKKKVNGPLCAIAGYDAYQAWVAHSTHEERLKYDSIAVVPRGDELPKLFDHNAFLLPIAAEYKYVSSSKKRRFSTASKEKKRS